MELEAPPRRQAVPGAPSLVIATEPPLRPGLRQDWQLPSRKVANSDPETAAGLHQDTLGVDVCDFRCGAGLDSGWACC